MKPTVISATEVDLKENEVMSDVEKENHLEVINGDSKSIKCEHHSTTKKELNGFDLTQRSLSIASVMGIGPIMLSDGIQSTGNGKW